MVAQHSPNISAKYRSFRITIGGPRVVVNAAAFHALFDYRSRRFEKNKNNSSPSTRKTQYCGEPP